MTAMLALAPSESSFDLAGLVRIVGEQEYDGLRALQYGRSTDNSGRLHVARRNQHRSHAPELHDLFDVIVSSLDEKQMNTSCWPMSRSFFQSRRVPSGAGGDLSSEAAHCQMIGPTCPPQDRVAHSVPAGSAAVVNDIRPARRAALPYRAALRQSLKHAMEMSK
jgi:hypothetical protein